MKCENLPMQMTKRITENHEDIANLCINDIRIVIATLVTFIGLFGSVV